MTQTLTQEQGQGGSTQPDAPKATPLLTKFLILERAEEVTADGPSPIWREAGIQKATDRDAALRAFLGEPARMTEGVYAAVSESAWKPRRAKPKISISEA